MCFAGTLNKWIIKHVEILIEQQQKLSKGQTMTSLVPGNKWTDKHNTHNHLWNKYLNSESWENIRDVSLVNFCTATEQLQLGSNCKQSHPQANTATVCNGYRPQQNINLHHRHPNIYMQHPWKKKKQPLQELRRLCADATSSLFSWKRSQLNAANLTSATSWQAAQ